MAGLLKLWNVVHNIENKGNVLFSEAIESNIEAPDMNELDTYDIPEDEDTQKEETTPPKEKQRITEGRTLDTEDDMHDMFDDVFGADDNSDDTSIDVDNNAGDTADTGNAVIGDNADNFDIPEFGADDNIEKTEADATDEAMADSAEDDTYIIADDDEVKRAKLVANRLVDLYDSYKAQIKTLSGLEIPVDKERRIKPIIKEYVRILRLLFVYITEQSKHNTSYVKMKRFAEFKYLFVVLDKQLQLFIEDEKKNKDNTSTIR